MIRHQKLKKKRKISFVMSSNNGRQLIAITKAIITKKNIIFCRHDWIGVIRNGVTSYSYINLHDNIFIKYILGSRVNLTMFCYILGEAEYVVRQLKNKMKTNCSVC